MKFNLDFNISDSDCINQMSIRAAMGLPEYYIPLSLEIEEEAYQELSQCSPKELVDQVENPEIPLNVTIAPI